jgi:hypothetical protein
VNSLTTAPVPVATVRGFIESTHYSKSINGCKVTQCYGLYSGGSLVGAILFGELSTTAWKKYGSVEGDVIELRRLCLLDTCPRNTASKFISDALKQLKKHFNYRVCISYADPYHGHVGFVYQAANWQFIGVTPKDKKLITPEGRAYHSRALRTKYKGEYKPFVKRLRALHEKGLLKEITVPGKYIYRYNLEGKQKPTEIPYPKL